MTIDMETLHPWDGDTICEIADGENPVDHAWSDETETFFVSVQRCERCGAFRATSSWARVVVRRVGNQMRFGVEDISLAGMISGCRRCHGVTPIGWEVRLAENSTPGDGSRVKWLHLDCRQARQLGFGPNRSDEDYLAAWKAHPRQPALVAEP